MPASKVSSFVQVDDNKGHGGRDRGNKRGGDDKTYNKKYWKDKECYKCGKKGHPESHSTKKKRDKDNDDKITKTTSSRASTKKLEKYAKKMSRAFTIVNTQLKILNGADSDPPDSEDEDEALYFQMVDIDFGKSDFQFA